MPKRRNLKKGRKKFKRIDISDVESHIEKKSFEERVGGAFLERKDEDLFLVDVEGSFTGKCQPLVKQKPVAKSSKPKKRAGVLTKIPKIPPVIKKKTIERRSKTINPWKVEDISSSDWLGKEVFQHLGKIRTNPKSNYLMKPSGLPAVAVPHPGISYNPSYDDHQELMKKAVDAMNTTDEVTRKEKRKSRIAYISEEEKAQAEWEEATSGLLAADSSGESDSESNDDPDLEDMPIHPERKTEQQRKQEKFQKAAEKAKRAEKNEKLRLNDVFRIRTFMKELNEDEKYSKRRQEAKRARTALEPFRTKVLGKLQYEEPEIEVPFAHQLTGSLRTIQSSHSILSSCYKSMQARNIVEPRQRQIHTRKYKLKKITKKSHKEEWDVKDFKRRDDM